MGNKDIAETESTSIIQVIEKVATNPDVDVDKMEKLLQMQERILDRNAETAFAAAMTNVQSLLPTVLQNADNPQTHSRYSNYEIISRTIKPIYTKEGFSLTFSEGESSKENYIRINAIIRHNQGHKESHYLDMPLDSAGIKGNVNKTPTHATGSTYSYGRRYLTCMIFDVATGDDVDGNQPLTLISEDQLQEIVELIAAKGADKEGFLKFLKLDSLDKLPASSFAGAYAALKAKK